MATHLMRPTDKECHNGNKKSALIREACGGNSFKCDFFDGKINCRGEFSAAELRALADAREVYTTWLEGWKSVTHDDPRWNPNLYDAIWFRDDE